MTKLSAPTGKNTLSTAPPLSKFNIKEKVVSPNLDGNSPTLVACMVHFSSHRRCSGGDPFSFCSAPENHLPEVGLNPAVKIFLGVLILAPSSLYIQFLRYSPINLISLKFFIT